MYLYKIPASITLAQGILESGSGRSDLAERANNHFGIKCPGDYSGKGYYKDDDKRNECFRVYKNAEESFRDHSIFLTKPRYAELFKLSETDYKGWAKGLKKAGYATNTKYPQLLIDIIEQNKLYEYDKNPERYLAKDDSRRTKSLNVIAPNPAKEASKERVSPPTLKRNKVNGIKCLQVKQGDTFYGLSKKAGLTIAELKYLNDMSEDHVLQVGEYLFLEPKKKKNKEQTPPVKKKVTAEVSEPVSPKQNPPVEEGIPEEVVAVIAAAVASVYGKSGRAKIKSIKKAGGRSAWANAGVLDNTRPF